MDKFDPKEDLDIEPQHDDALRSSEPAKGNVAQRASRIRSRLVFTFLDAACIVTGYSLAQITYFRDKAPGLYWQRLAVFLLVALVVTLVANHVFGLYGRMWRHAGVEEARQLTLSAAVVVCVLVALYPLGWRYRLEHVPVIVIAIGCMFSTLGMGVLRFHSRLFAWQRGTRRVGLRVAIVGSHDAGAAAIREMLRSPGAGLVPVAVFDDDVRSHGLSMIGVPVVGAIDDIPHAASRYTLQQVLLAIPHPPPETVERVLQACNTAGLTMKVLPGVSHLVDGTRPSPSLRQVREPQIEDLLGREPVPIDLATVRRSLEGRRVLVTGAGGSIGSEICRQVAELDPSLLVLLDHDETHLHDTAATVGVPCEQALVDITNRPALLETFERYRPEIVFHAAAHKHVPVLEQYPIEAATNNVFGTINVVDVAVHVGVQRFVQISSDKAVRPSSVMGASKRIAEQILLSRAPRGASYCTVRFGNVLGSRGSVIPTFTRQIAKGGPVTVTDERMTRFFMSVEEAVQLVLESSVLSDGDGEVFMLEMGEPVRILDLAERMIRLSGYQVGVDIPIEIIGMRTGEKLDEELRTPDEEVLTTYHPYINQLIPIRVPAEEFAEGLANLKEAEARREADTVKELLFSVGTLGQVATPDQPTPDQPTPDQQSVTAGNGHRPAANGRVAVNGRVGDEQHRTPETESAPASASEQVPA